MARKNHKWNGTVNHKCVDGGTVACVLCGCVKQYVKGIVTYFINDTVYDRKAPKCTPNNQTT